MDPNTKFILDIAVPCVCLLIIGVYHTYLIIFYQIKPNFFNIGVQIKSRKNWVYSMLFMNNQEILSIQTLRNSIMSASFSASISSALAFYMMTLTQRGVTTKLQIFQYLILACIFFLSFIFFAFNVRSTLHLGFLLTAKNMEDVILQIKLAQNKNVDQKGLNPETTVDIDTIGKVDKMRLSNLKRAKRHMVISTVYYTIGNRFLFLAVPVAFW